MTRVKNEFMSSSRDSTKSKKQSTSALDQIEKLAGLKERETITEERIMNNLQGWKDKYKRDLQQWKNKWNRYLIVLVILIIPIVTIIGMINEMVLGRVFLGALCVAVFAFLIRDCNKPSISCEEESWRQFCSEIGAEFIKEKSFFSESSKCIVMAKNWTITFDAHTTPNPSPPYHIHTETRVNAFFVNKDGFQFKIYRSGTFSELGINWGMQKIEIGNPVFDLSFIIKSNDKVKVKKLFADTKIRQLIQAQPSIELGIKTSFSRKMSEL